MTDTPTQAELLEALRYAIDAGHAISRNRPTKAQHIDDYLALLEKHKHAMAAGVELANKVPKTRDAVPMYVGMFVYRHWPVGKLRQFKVCAISSTSPSSDINNYTIELLDLERNESLLSRPNVCYFTLAAAQPVDTT